MIARSAARFLEEADAAPQRRLDRCFDQLKSEPRIHPNICRLHGKLAGHLCFRVGDYRVIYWIDEPTRTVTVTTIAHRREVYE